MKKVTKFLLWTVLIAGVFSIGLTFYDTIVLRDYQIIEIEE